MVRELDYLRRDVLKFVLEHEGAYSNDPDDPGGETFCGLRLDQFTALKRVAEEHGRVDDVAVEVWNILTGRKEIDVVKYKPAELVRDIYYTVYFTFDVPFSTEGDIFTYWDTKVNIGKKNAIRVLQRVLQKLGYNLIADGAFGPVTHECLYAAAKRHVNFYDLYIPERITYYVALCKKNPKLYKFLGGWVNRCANLIARVKEFYI